FIATMPAGRLFLRRRKADACRDRDPVRVFAGDIASVNEIHREPVDRPPAQPGLQARLCLRRGFCPTEQTEDLSSQRPDVVRRPQIEAGAVKKELTIGTAIPLPAGIQIY